MQTLYLFLFFISTILNFERKPERLFLLSGGVIDSDWFVIFSLFFSNGKSFQVWL